LHGMRGFTSNPHNYYTNKAVLHFKFKSYFSFLADCILTIREFTDWIDRLEDLVEKRIDA